MNLRHIAIAAWGIALLGACTPDKLEEKGFPVGGAGAGEAGAAQEGIAKDSLTFETRPSAVLLTGIPKVRLATVYKVNFDKEGGRFIGGNGYHGGYSFLDGTDGNQWNNNYMPGLEAVYGYNLVNIAHHDNSTNTGKLFFEKPVLVRTLYFPSFSKDSLYHVPVQRNYFMVSVYDEDTNKDGQLNTHDLRRFYWFDTDGIVQAPLVPKDYSVLRSDYDPGNDFMFVSAKLDENGNGRVEDVEPLHIFWVDLKDPARTGRMY